MVQVQFFTSESRGAEGTERKRSDKEEGEEERQKGRSRGEQWGEEKGAPRSQGGGVLKVCRGGRQKSNDWIFRN